MIKLDEIKEGDLFNFTYNEEHRKEYFYHCFDGNLLAVKCGEDLILQDTYWGYNYSYDGGVKFKLDKVLSLGELKFICNINSVDKIDKNTWRYYSEEDKFNLSYQHSCYEFYVIKKGAKRNKEVMLNLISEKRKLIQNRLSYLTLDLEHLVESRIKLESGNLDSVYIPID